MKDFKEVEQVKSIYESILLDPEICEIYKEVENYAVNYDSWAFHNFTHVKNVTDIVEKTLTLLNFEKAFIYKAMIGCLLHDTGYTKGKTGHPERSCEFARDYFERKKIDFEGKELVLEAILNHSEGFDTDNPITLAIIFADKLDIKKNRITKSGMNVIGNRQYGHIEDVKINIENNCLKIDFVTDDVIDLDEFYGYYFTDKVFKAIESFAKCFKLEHEVNFMKV